MLGTCVIGFGQEGLEAFGTGSLRGAFDLTTDVLDIGKVEGQPRMAWLTVACKVDGQPCWLLIAYLPARDHKKRAAFWGVGRLFDRQGINLKAACGRILSDRDALEKRAFDQDSGRLNIEEAKVWLRSMPDQGGGSRVVFPRNKILNVQLGQTVSKLDDGEVIRQFIFSRSGKKSPLFFLTDAAVDDAVYFDGAGDKVQEEPDWQTEAEELQTELDELHKEIKDLESTIERLEREKASLKRSLDAAKKPGKAQPSHQSDHGAVISQPAQWDRRNQSTKPSPEDEDDDSHASAHPKPRVSDSVWPLAIVGALVVFATVWTLMSLGVPSFVAKLAGSLGFESSDQTEGVFDHKIAEFDPANPRAYRDAWNAAPGGATRDAIKLYQEEESKAFKEADGVGSLAAYTKFLVRFGAGQPGEPWVTGKLEAARNKQELLVGLDRMASDLKYAGRTLDENENLTAAVMKELQREPRSAECQQVHQLENADDLGLAKDCILSIERVRDIQVGLAVLGWYDGNPNGLADKNTNAAWKDFAKIHAASLQNADLSGLSNSEEFSDLVYLSDLKKDALAQGGDALRKQAAAITIAGQNGDKYKRKTTIRPAARATDSRK